ncbi:MAG: hypothetical protein BWX80_03695 [Candidatus Hydrogenedentes bacterium ADurb.Bin101]|nr:MAG: hypothetical protein BWX80_03695 [Candidatus Hydrogenedentes bacterium ADurb.Bin101]
MVIPTRGRLDLLGVGHFPLEQSRRDNFHGQRVPVLAAMDKQACHGKLKTPEHTDNLALPGDQLSIQPDIGRVIDALEMQRIIPLPVLFRKVEFHTVPPGVPEGAVFPLHKPQPILVAGYGLHVQSEIGVRIYPVIDKRGEYGLRYGGVIPRGHIHTGPGEFLSSYVDISA